MTYISKDDGNFEIYRINHDGTGKVRLTAEAHSDGLPVWSPNGSWIAFRWIAMVNGPFTRCGPMAPTCVEVVNANVLPVWFFEKMGWRP